MVEICKGKEFDLDTILQVCQKNLLKIYIILCLKAGKNLNFVGKDIDQNYSPEAVKGKMVKN